MRAQTLVPAIAGGSGGRIAPVRQAPLWPFDPSPDGYGDVHTVLPPEQVIPPRFADPLFLVGDVFGTTLSGDYEPKKSEEIIAAGGCRMISGQWRGLWIPFAAGANSTPPTMLMTPMLELYPPAVQEADFTEHAQREHDDFCSAIEQPWNAAENGRSFSRQERVAWFRHVKSRGFRTVGWQSGRPPDAPSDLLQALLDAGVLDFYIHGKEVDAQMIWEDFEASLQRHDAYIGGRIPIGVHFTASEFDPEDPTRRKRGMGYPIGFPRETFLNDWSPYDGRVHLMQQLCVDAPAGLQGANMNYARKRVNCGIGEGALGEARRSRVIAFETSATAQLYGKMSETDGCRRSWEALCGTRDDPRELPVSGSMNGLRRPDGWGLRHKGD